MEVYERIKARRKEIGLTADDVADALGVSRATIYRYESADIEKVPTTIIEPLAKVLKCSIAYLMGLEELSNADNDLCLSDLEKDILDCSRKLNNTGKQKLLERANELLELGYVEKGEGQKMA